MGVITYMLIALAHFYVANSYPLKKPIALSVLSKDLQSLEAAFPTAEFWPDKKIIKYDDELQIVVNYDEHAAQSYTGQAFLRVAGMVTLAKMKKLPRGFHEMAEKQEVRKLLFHNSWFYLESPAFEPLLNIDDYYIVEYRPLLYRNLMNPTIEYLPGSELENELMDFIPKIRYENSLTGAKVLKTSFRMKNGIKLDVQYDQQNDIAIFYGDYQVLVLTDERNVITKSVHLDKLSFFLYKQTSPDLSQLGLIHGVRLAPPPSKPINAFGKLLKIKRDNLLKDMVESRPNIKKGTPSIAGMIKYDSGRIYMTNSIPSNQKDVLTLTGDFVANDGTSFKALCVAFPGGHTDMKDLNRFKNSEVFSENPVFFSCPDKSGNVQTVLQEDANYIELDVGQPGATDIAKKYTYVEPYLEYISYEKFLQTMQIVADSMQLRCVKGYPRRSFRLFVNIFLNFDCSTGIAYFDALDLWLGPGNGTSFVRENLPGVSYDSQFQHFEYNGNVLADFKVRQLYPVLPDKVPLDMQYPTAKGQRNLAFELRSIEWDLQDTRNNLIQNILPQWGVIHVDQYVLLVAEKAKEDIEGEKVTTIVIKCDVMQPETCTERRCAGKEEIIYDGDKITMKDSRGVESAQVPNTVYWPNTYKLPVLNDIFSVSYKIRYVKLPTFKKHMKELVGNLVRYCSALKGKPESEAKLTLHIQYFNNKEPTIIAYYDCALSYLFFVSDFKIIKFPNIYGVSTAYRPGEESTVGLQSSPRSPEVPYFDDVNLNENIDRTKPLFETEEDALRRKYSAYIMQDLLYDPVENILHSKSMFLTEVFALRPLPTNVRESSHKGNPLKLKVSGGPEVHVFSH